MIHDVKKVIEKYIEGTKTGNVEMLRGVFHSNAIMSGDLFGKQLVIGSPKLFFKDVEGEVASSDYKAEIATIDVVGQTASVNLIERNLKGANFSNWFHLQNVEGQWLIISKLFSMEVEQ